MAVERSIDQVIYVSTFTGVKSACVISPGSVGYDINCGVITSRQVAEMERESVCARINLYKQMKELAIYNTKIK